ncbi:MAG: MFS transporter [Alphaproteobacteria bacterium]|nr:MFS transporter [Alphaproteobacteria bacterium]
MAINDKNRKWWILSAMGGVLGLILLDETVVGVALPTIQRELGLSVVGGHWVINSYLLVFAGLTAAGGRLGDIIGVKKLVIAGIAIFGLASLASGFAESGAWLIAARAIQGIGAAAILPGSMAMITIAFPEEQRGMAIGIYGSIGTVFLSLGPLAGGFFTDFASWRWIFWINPPIVIVIALVVLAAWTDPPREDASARIDFPGLLTLVGGLGMLVFAIMQGPEWGWSDPAVWALMFAGLVILGVFVVVERRPKMPLIEVDLFRNASFSVCNLVVFTGQVNKMSLFVFGALYFQHGLGMSPLIAGLALLAATVPVALASGPAGWIADRFGPRRPALAGLAVMAISVIWLGIATTWNRYEFLVLALLINGFFQPLLFVPPMRVVMGAVPAEKKGQAGGIVLSAQFLGGTIGVACLGTLLAMTGSYQAVFLATGAWMVFVLVLGWFAIVDD